MTRLEHVGIAVDDFQAAEAVLDRLLGLLPYKSETVEREGVRTHFLDAGSAKLELLEALAQDSPVAAFLEKRGPGMHHLAFEVDDLDATYERLQAEGFRLLGMPRPGADGKRIFFVHPRDTAGVLVEFCAGTRMPDASKGDERPGLRVRGPVSESLVMALKRWFRVEAGPREGDALLRAETGRRVMIDPAPSTAVGPDDLEIRTDGGQPVSSGAVCLPAAARRALPDPWGALARIAADHLTD